MRLVESSLSAKAAESWVGGNDLSASQEGFALGIRVSTQDY